MYFSQNEYVTEHSNVAHQSDGSARWAPALPANDNHTVRVPYLSRLVDIFIKD